MSEYIVHETTVNLFKSLFGSLSIIISILCVLICIYKYAKCQEELNKNKINIVPRTYNQLNINNCNNIPIIII